MFVKFQVGLSADVGNAFQQDEDMQTHAQKGRAKGSRCICIFEVTTTVLVKTARVRRGEWERASVCVYVCM